MMFLKNILSFKFLNKNNFKKVNKNIFNIVNKFFEEYFIKSNIKIFHLSKFKFYTSKNKLEKFKQKENNLSIINKVFEGSNSIIIDNHSFHYNFGVIFNTEQSDDCCTLNTINKNYDNIKFTCKYIENIYKPGYILYPLTFGNYCDSNNFIYSIYKYLSIKNCNTYRSCMIALFYYYMGLLFSLILLYKGNNINVLNSNISVIVSRLSSFVFVTDFNYSDIYISNILSIKLISIINNSLYLSKIAICNYRPYLVGLTKYILTNSGIFSKLSFQDTLKTLKNIILEPKIDWNVDCKSNVILADFIPVGSGWYRYFIN
ncbi:DNA-directed RNA polymerase subunit beta (apicoplast) [Theileria parva strain Muguga]|uniref:DNA-directed RNA polymerase beta'' chain, putative n=1 Tax=Theileria parva TaxID=5875 RepID=Q4MY80_THEPA|nr:DNA-directed RNA polymerase subunit beta [Theileria parva strain Muguga]|eukprot:XP_762712.1 DNA-directed RNA polymerase subunit beta'' (apicoplast) [Theileria parva strain Muguga]